MNNIEEGTLEKRINTDNYLNFEKLLRVTARVLAMYQKMPRTTLKNVTKVLILKILLMQNNSELYNHRKLCMKTVEKNIYICFCPQKRNEGIYIRWEDVVSNGWKWATTDRNSYCYHMSIVSQNSMQNTYIKGGTLRYYQQPVKFD